MAIDPLSEFLHKIRRASLRRDEAGCTDGQLLDAYVRSREEAAFAALLHRHGPMVWGVCRRILDNEADAEDAFQATFLVLVRKAASIVPREKIANWLYGVARQTAVKARALAMKRKAREKQVENMPEPAAAEQGDANDLFPLLDRELSRLADKYRTAIVLCDLEGKSYKEAAGQLGCPEGTLAARLARGRAMLAKRLARHGLGVTGGTLAAVLSQSAPASVPASVVSSTIKIANILSAGQAAATAIISVNVAALTEGVLKTMLLTKLKIATAVLLVASTAAFTWGAWATRQQPLPSGDVKAKSPTKPAEPPKENKKNGQENRRQAAEEAKDDSKLLNGIWKVVALEADGRKAPSLALEGMRWSFKDAEVHMRDPGDKSWREKASLKIDSSKTPKHIDLVGLEGSMKGKTVQGIFKLETDRLVICLRDSESAAKGRPTEFKTEAGSGLGLIALERVPPEGKKNGQGNRRQAAEEAKDDSKLLDGVWKVVALESDGKKAPAQALKGMRYSFKGSEMQFSDPREEPGSEKCSVKLDSSKTPKYIDLIVLEESRNVATFQGIFKLEKGRIVICMREPKAAKKGRPKEFLTVEGSGLRMITLERVPPAKKDEQKKKEAPLEVRLNYVTFGRYDNKPHAIGFSVNKYHAELDDRGLLRSPLPLAENVEVLIDGKKAKITDLLPADKIVLRLAADNKSVAKIEVSLEPRLDALEKEADALRKRIKRLDESK